MKNPKALVFFLTMAVLSLALACLLARSHRSSPPSDDNANATQPAAFSQVEPAPEFQTLVPPQIASNVRLSTNDSASPARLEPTPYTRQLIESLSQFDLSRGAISKEQADQWKVSLQALTQQGEGAVPAIREFLERNQDLNFAAVSGAELLGQTSLRAALIDALQQIGGPEALDVMLQTLRTTTLPSEIALLAKNLDAAAPGKYRQETVTAVRETLALASKGELPRWDVGPLFQMLTAYGEATAVATLEQLQSQWKYYASISLAGLPTGEGIPILIQQAQGTSAGTGTARDFAFQLLAQIAPQSPDASAALLELAGANQIPDSAWPGILEGLTGDQYQIGTITNPLAGLKSYHIERGNQNFYSLPFDPNASGDQVRQRIALIDQLSELSPSLTVRARLQTARATLVGKK